MKWLATGMVLLILAVVLFCTPALEAVNFPASCHCFRDREYDPTRKFSADDYVVATTNNAFFAANFGITKRDVIMMKMQGGIQEVDLLIAFHTAKVMGMAADELLAQKKEAISWQTILQRLPLSDKEQPISETVGLTDQAVVVALRQGLDPQQAAEQIRTLRLSRFFVVSQPGIERLRQQGLTGRQVTVFLTLAAQVGGQANGMTPLFTQQGLSLTEIVHHFGLTPGGLDEVVAALAQKKQTTTKQQER